MAKKSEKRENFFSRRNIRKTIRRTLHLVPHPDDVEEKEEKEAESSTYFLQTVRQGKAYDKFLTLSQTRTHWCIGRVCARDFTTQF